MTKMKSKKFSKRWEKLSSSIVTKMARGMWSIEPKRLPKKLLRFLTIINTIPRGLRSNGLIRKTGQEELFKELEILMSSVTIVKSSAISKEIARRREE